MICKLKVAAKQIQRELKDHKEGIIMVVADGQSESSVAESIFLLGGFLMLAQGLTLASLATAFKDLAHRTLLGVSGRYDVAILHAWQALEHARDLGWMDWTHGSDDDQPFLIDEFLHYADAANGSIHIVAPGQLLLFRDPVDLPDSQQWAVVMGSGGACRRMFSPAYYADLFAEQGVAAVACLTESSSSAAAFAAQGIEARDLCPGGGASILRTLDGLLSLSSAAAPVGGVAVHSGRGAAWPADTAVVVTTWLVGRAGFEERAAWAWLQMLCPWLLNGEQGSPASA